MFSPITLIAYAYILVIPFFALPILQMLLIDGTLLTFPDFLKTSIFPWVILIDTLRERDIKFLDIEIIRIYLTYFSVIAIMGFIRAIIVKRTYSFLLMNKDESFEVFFIKALKSIWIMSSAFFLLVTSISSSFFAGGNYLYSLGIATLYFLLATTVNTITLLFLKNVNKEDLSEDRINHLFYFHLVNYLIFFSFPVGLAIKPLKRL